MAAETNGKGSNGSGPATNGKAYPIEDHTYDVVVVGAGGAGLIAAKQHHHHHDDRHDQQHHRDRGDALAPEVRSAGMRGAEAADARQRRAHRGRFGRGHRPPPIV